MRLMRRLVLQPFAADLRAWSAHGWCAPGPGRLQIALLLVRHAGLRATLLHRIGHWAVVARVPGIPMLIQALNLVLHGIEIAPSVPVGPGFYMPHTTGSVVHADSIGAGVELQGGITVGQRHGDGFPTLRDGALIGAGARVLGHIVIGEGARVGANSVVLDHVEAGTTVVGVPARVARRASTEPASDLVDAAAL